MAIGEFKIRTPTEHDATAIAEIDAQGLATGHATFREKPHDWQSFKSSFMTENGLAVVAEDDASVLGWAAGSQTSKRAVYNGVGEVSIYVADDRRRIGVGQQLMNALVTQSEDAGYWTLVAQIFPENVASIRLHDAMGFQRVEIRRRLAKMSFGPMAGCWRDVVFLERRGTVVGT